MRIVVAVKYVPDINAERRFVDARVDRSPDVGTLNELDENAIEAALRLVEALPDDEREGSEVVAVTVAPAEGDVALRKSFQMGVHRAVRVSDVALAGSDYFGTAAALAAAVRRLGAEAPVDLVVTGMAALDGLGSVVPALLGAELDLPVLTLAKKIALDHAGDAATLRITRETDEATETLSAPLPAVLSVADTANRPRFPDFKLIMAARTKQIEQWTAADLGLDAAAVGTAGARTEALSAEPRPARAEVELVVDKGEGGNALADFLIRNELV
ncbi:electron transfer flavoprotein subunit beta/FixA family protein [Isoptericola sp. NEAU-Y5]|uniref:Electron transfer flavoprotein subunit beta/FixA family protein n=1 Tax=Isoptericola luteus TaxID=2879484 RepID=A0ABS7ZJK4_9MICO|nr:electron transfer flavoprotein subunit beta/FixA family protein [Isoptericola sp. NEAU-Y5]MCA5895178.1 electron transfer flavoprotein subunit beta/FixA family protein [Isoptericola sp. NEAU-Y5]